VPPFLGAGTPPLFPGDFFGSPIRRRNMTSAVGDTPRRSPPRPLGGHGLAVGLLPTWHLKTDARPWRPMILEVTGWA
jgi:hypothetical protein